MKKVYIIPSSKIYEFKISSVMQAGSTPGNGGSGTPGANGQAKDGSLRNIWNDFSDNEE